jgi:hypothetical protein
MAAALVLAMADQGAAALALLEVLQAAEWLGLAALAWPVVLPVQAFSTQAVAVLVHIQAILMALAVMVEEALAE